MVFYTVTLLIFLALFCLLTLNMQGGCEDMVFDLKNVGNVTVICEQDKKCNGTEMYCPPGVASCNLIGRSSNALQDVVV